MQRKKPTSPIPFLAFVEGSMALTLMMMAVGCSPAQFAKVSDPSQIKNDVPASPANPPVSGPETPEPQAKATEAFTQDSASNKIDILIVDDNSSSMDQEQSKMAARFSSFTSSLKDLDYQIGFTTTDLDSAKYNQDGRLMTWEGTSSNLLTPTTPNGDKVFKNSISRKETIGCGARGDCPSGNEQPLKATIRAIEQRFTANADFFRDKTNLAVIVLSDEDELSDGPPAATKPQEVINSFKAAFGESKKLAVYGIVVKSGDVACLAEQAAQVSTGNGAYFGTHVEELATLTGGSTSSICAPDYAKNLSAISQQVRKLVGTFELHKRPRSNSVQVVLTPAQNIAWKIIDNKVVFDTPPAAGSRIEVSYDY